MVLYCKKGTKFEETGPCCFQTSTEKFEADRKAAELHPGTVSKHHNLTELFQGISEKEFTRKKVQACERCAVCCNTAGKRNVLLI